MPTPFLAMSPVTGVTPSAQRYVTSASATQGVTFGTIEASNGVADQHNQRIVRFLGEDTWYAVSGTSIYRTTDAGASYSVVYADGLLGTSSGKAGPFILYPNGVATLVIVARSGTTAWRVFTSTDGSTWNVSGAFSTFDPSSGTIHQVTEWRGSLYGFGNSGTAPNTLIWNTTNVTFVSGPASGNFQNAAMCVYNDRLFALACQNGNSAGRTLYEFLAGAWVPVDDNFLGAVSGYSFADGKMALFVDPTSDLLVGITVGISGVSGWRAFTWNNALTRTEITSAIGIQSVLGSASAGVHRIAVMVDGPENPTATLPSIFLYVAANGTAGTTFTMCKWNGISSSITSIGSGGNVQHAIPFGVRNGGSVFWTSGQRHVERISATPVDGGVRYGFKIYSPNPSVDTVSVRWLVANATGEYTRTPYATLYNPSAGTLSAGDTQIDGLDAADNGVTTFFVTWLAETDGYAIGEFAKTTPELFV